MVLGIPSAVCGRYDDVTYMYDDVTYMYDDVTYVSFCIRFVIRLRV